MPFTLQPGMFLTPYPQTRRGRRIARIDRRAAQRFLRRLTGKKTKITTSYSHILWVYCVWGDGTVFVAEQCEHGIRVRPLLSGEFVCDVYDWEKPLTVADLKKIRAWWDNNEGKPYGHFHLLRLIWWSILGSLLPVNYEKVALTGSGTVCVTACDNACLEAKRNVWKRLPPNIMAINVFVRSPQLKLVCKGYTP